MQAAGWLGIKDLETEIDAGTQHQSSSGPRSGPAFGGLGFSYKQPRQENYFKVESKLKSKLRLSAKDKDELGERGNVKGVSGLPHKVGHDPRTQDSDEEEGKAEKFIGKKHSTKPLSKLELLKPGKRKRK